MSIETQMLIVFQLVVAALLSTVIGLNRERRKKDAGLRTHILIGMAACLFTSLSVYAFPDSESSRVAAQIVTGVGFIGAGVIYVGNDGVHDLTTAAGIWYTAAMGVAVGVGAFVLAVVSTLFVWVVLDLLLHWEKRQYPTA